MDVFDEENSGRVDIPGLPDSERAGKKGKKKGGAAAKKTLSLQNFLQDENQEPSQADPGDTNNLEAHFAKLNLDQEELIVMESCHSYIHDLLRQLGPTNAMDPILQQEINGFPPEAKRIIQKVGGYRNFILRSKDLAVVDKIVAAKSDLRNAQEMAFKEIFNNLPTSTRNDNIHSEIPKEIWNSNKSNLNKGLGGQDLQLEVPRVDSLFNDHHQAASHYTAQQNLLKGLGQPSGFPSGDPASSQPSFTYTHGNQQEERLWKLQEENQELLHRVSDRDQLQQELNNLRANYVSLESLQHNTKNDLLMAQSELEQARVELARARTVTTVHAAANGSGAAAGQRQDLIFNLQKNLETEQLRNLNLTQELENKKQQPPGYYNPATSGIPSGPWQTPLPPGGPSLPTLTGDKDLLGLRSMVPGPWSGDAVSSQSSPAPSLLPPSSQGNSFLQGGHRGHDMFGGLGLGGRSEGLGLGTPAEFKPLLNLQGSGSSSSLTQLGLSSMLDSPSLASPTRAATHSPATLSKQQQQQAPALPAGAAAVPPGKTARQEMLVKKLVAMLPPGTTEETIKNSIQVLRAKNGKLSGWPTSKIASAISDLLKSGEVV